MIKDNLQIDAQLSRIEQVTDQLLERRIIEYGYTFSAISANLIQNAAIATSAAFAMFLVLSFVFSYTVQDALITSGILWSMVFAIYTIINFSKDEIGLIKVVYMIGALSNWKKIIYLNRTVIELQEQLEATSAVSANTLKSEIIGQSRKYFQGGTFDPSSKAFPFLMKRDLAYLDGDGKVVLKANSINDLSNKLKKG